MSALTVIMLILAAEFALGCLVALTFLLRWQAYRRSTLHARTEPTMPSLRH